jgi:hypothetical protein
MFLKNAWWEIKSLAANPTLRFLFMFIGVVPGTLILFATSVHDFNVLQQPGLGWSILAIAILVIVSSVMGCWRFRHTPVVLSLLAAPWVKKGRI